MLENGRLRLPRALSFTSIRNKSLYTLPFRQFDGCRILNLTRL
jgi:hypothetical protein